MFGYILYLYFGLVLAQKYIYIYKMYPVNRFKTNCGKSLIHFPAIWGLCWYNFFVAQVVWMILGKLPVTKMLNFHMLKKLHKRKLRTCKIWGKTRLTTVESTSAGAKIWVLWEVWFMKLVMPLVWIMNRNEQMQHKHMKVMVHIWICIGKISIQIGPANICLTSNHTLALPTKAGGLLGKIRHTFRRFLAVSFIAKARAVVKMLILVLFGVFLDLQHKHGVYLATTLRIKTPHLPKLYRKGESSLA